MKIVIIGAGVIGVSSAYYLARDGHEVTVLEAAAAPALETSLANGGQISPCESGPWASPAALAMGLSSLWRSDSPFRLRPAADAFFWRWLAAFLIHCRPDAFARGLAVNLALARFSLEQLAALRQHAHIAYDGRQQGILRLYRSRPAFARARRQAAMLRRLGQPIDCLSAAECRAVEPAIRPDMPLAGGLYAADNESGDVHLFTRALHRIAADMGARFHFNHRVGGFTTGNNRITRVLAAETAWEADAVVLAAGCGTAALGRMLGLCLPVYPLKGYSVTMTAADGAPAVSVTDEARKIVISRLGNRIRAAGLAELCGYDKNIDMRRARLVSDALFDIFPDAGDGQSAEYWAGLRPMTPSCTPIVGRAATRHAPANLYINSGHGSLGWTMACGSAALLADLIARRPPDPRLRPLLSRYS